jgi:tRNA(Ile)-lysidine synthase
MASSRKSHPTPDPVSAALLTALADAVGQARVAPPEPFGLLAARPARRGRKPTTLLLALSGGRDSMALLHAACSLRARRAPGFAHLAALHVHHGLQPAADDFEACCVAACAERDVPLQVVRVQVNVGHRGIEAAARHARYAALAAQARAEHAAAVLTAHHRDDRIETFLINWLRGAGPDGLAAFGGVRPLLQDVALLRPWVDIARAQIDAYVAAQGLSYVDDPSNRDTRLLRNALRAQVLPELERVRPGYARAAARSIDLVSDAADVLAEIGAADLAQCAEPAAPGAPPVLRLDRMAALPPARRALLVRRWLADAGQETPPRARLSELLAQALAARADARLRIRVGDLDVRRYRGRLVLQPAPPADAEAIEVHWHGEAELPVPAWGGVLHFAPTAAAGFDRQWLLDAPLVVCGRRGGERFRPHAGRPSRTLKRAFQEAGVAEFERTRLPLVWRDDALIFVAGLGPDVRLLADVEACQTRVQITWQADAGLLGARD